MKEAKDETSRARPRLDDFSVLQFPLLPQPPSVPFLRREFLDIRRVGVIGVIAGILSFAPILSAQTSGTPQGPAATAALSHDLSGVWMQYRDGDVPGTPGMNGVNERFRPPLTPWGQAAFDAAKPLSGSKAVAGQEDNSALRCEPSGPPQVLVLPNPWEIVQIPGRVFMFFEEQHIWRTIWADGRPLPKDPDPSWLGYSGRALGRHDTFVLSKRSASAADKRVGRSVWKSADFHDPPDGALPAIESRHSSNNLRSSSRTPRCIRSPG